MGAIAAISDCRSGDESYFHERPTTDRDVKVVAELVTVLYKISSRWEVVSLIPQLLSLKQKGASSIPPVITVQIIKQRPDLLKKVQEMLKASSHYGAKLFLYGAWPDQGLLERLKDTHPEKFQSWKDAEQWVREQWGIAPR